MQRQTVLLCHSLGGRDHEIVKDVTFANMWAQQSLYYGT
jgi:hypothetical protein